VAAALSGAGALDREPVLCRVSERVATVTLNRPDRLNSWTPAMEQGWFQVLDAVLVDPGVRAVVLTGAGRGFCAGLDAEHVAARSSGAEAAPTRARPLSGLAAFPKPVVAAVNGPAVGLGLALALCCDVRFAAPEARFVPMFSRLGLVPEFGTSWLLPRIVGSSVALDLLLSSRPVDAEEAVALRLADRLVPASDLLPAAEQYARLLAERCSPLSMAAAKRQLLDDQHRSLQASEVESSARNRSDEGRADFREGAAALREGRAPEFPPLGPDYPDVRAWLRSIG
jgi:enoyl-CoA hydratase/carnithine racemase